MTQVPPGGGGVGGGGVGGGGLGGKQPLPITLVMNRIISTLNDTVLLISLTMKRQATAKASLNIAADGVSMGERLNTYYCSLILNN